MPLHGTSVAAQRIPAQRGGPHLTTQVTRLSHSPPATLASVLAAGQAGDEQSVGA